MEAFDKQTKGVVHPLPQWACVKQNVEIVHYH